MSADRAVHHAGVVVEHPQVPELVGQPSARRRRVVVGDADEHAQPAPDRADDLAGRPRVATVTARLATPAAPRARIAVDVLARTDGVGTHRRDADATTGAPSTPLAAGRFAAVNERGGHRVVGRAEDADFTPTELLLGRDRRMHRDRRRHPRRRAAPSRLRARSSSAPTTVADDDRHDRPHRHRGHVPRARVAARRPARRCAPRRGAPLAVAAIATIGWHRRPHRRAAATPMHSDDDRVTQPTGGRRADAVAPVVRPIDGLAPRPHRRRDRAATPTASPLDAGRRRSWPIADVRDRTAVALEAIADTDARPSATRTTSTHGQSTRITSSARRCRHGRPSDASGAER